MTEPTDSVASQTDLPSANVRPLPFGIAAVLVALAFISFDGELMRRIGADSWFDGFRYGWPLMLNTLDLIAMALCFWLISGVSLGRQWQVVGLNRPIVPAIGLAVMLFGPLLIALPFITGFSEDLSGPDVLFGGLIFPMYEEIVFRGLAIGVLMVHFGLRFWWATLIPSVVFGLLHMAQGNSPVEALSIFAITAFGGLWFGWIYWKWGMNLWPAFVLHAGLNTLWTVFALGETALGGQLGNILRVAIIIASIGLTWLALKRMRASAPARAAAAKEEAQRKARRKAILQADRDRMRNR